MTPSTSTSSDTSASVKLNLLIYKFSSLFGSSEQFADSYIIKALIGDSSDFNKRVYYNSSNPPVL